MLTRPRPPAIPFSAEHVVNQLEMARGGARWRLPSLWLLRTVKGSGSEESGKESGRAFCCNARTGTKWLIFRVSENSVCSKKLHGSVRAVGVIGAAVSHHAVCHRFETLEDADNRPRLRLHGVGHRVTGA